MLEVKGVSDILVAERELALLTEVADAHAFELWGDMVGRGHPLPLVGSEGAVTAYAFPYIIGARVFPDVEPTVLAGSRAAFGTIFVSPREAEHPVLRVLHGLHPAFTHTTRALRAARDILGDGAEVVRVLWLGVHQEYFEAAFRDKRVLLDVHTLKQIDARESLRECLPIPGRISYKAEPPLRKHPPLHLSPLPVLKLVPFPDCVPMVNWTWWCVPTAWTIAACYYDNFVPGVVGNIGYGRLVGYWFEEPQSGNNVPDFINQLIDPQTGTWRTGFNGFSDFIQKTYGYDFKTRDVLADASNDWAWADIVSEIDAGRPFVWAIAGHDTCAFGYRLASNGGKYVVLNTTWGFTDEWLHTMGIGLAAITPGGGTVGQDVALWKADGGESLVANKPTTLQWYVWGKQIEAVEIMFSADAGNTWNTEINAAPCVPGLNTHEWTPKVVTSRGRLRLRGRDASGTYIAGDGSHDNFTVLP